MQRGDRVGGRFEIVEKAASGGTGTVFRGRDVRSRRDVAVKVIAASTAQEAARFAREAQILAGFEDPGVVGYVAHGPEYLVMEWVEGETLRQRLDRAPLSARETIAAVRQLAGALAKLHAAGIVHRDIKPSNLMLADGHMKLVDFGIAHGSAGPRVTRTGMHVGTAGYMAPEQARGEREVGGATDMFALGCVLYECLAGVPAFRGDSAIALRAMVLLHDPPRLRTLAPALPEALDDLVMRLLDREAGRRPEAREVLGVLAAMEVDAPAPATRVADDVTTDAARGPVTSTCAVLIALDDPAALEEVPALAGGTAERFAGGAVTMRRDADAAAQLALELAAQLPGATIAIACGRSAGEAIDRSARLVEQLAIAAETGEPMTGAWIDSSAAGEIGAAFAVESHGSRSRLRGLA